MLSTLVIVALPHSRRVFWFSFGHWLSTPWFFSRSRTRLVFSLFFTQKTFFFFLWTVIRDIFISCSWPGFFCFFLVPWILVDIRLVYIYIYIYICIYIYILFIWLFIGSLRFGLYILSELQKSQWSKDQNENTLTKPEEYFVLQIASML